jgi:xanthine dehydrogenase accessory factor
MICGGRCAVLLAPIAPDRSREVFAAAAEAEGSARPFVLVTTIAAHGPPRHLGLAEDDRLLGTAGDAELDERLRAQAAEARSQEASRFVEGPVAALIHAVLPRPFVAIFGGGHIAIPLAHLAELAGFRVAVVDDREEFANRDRFPRAERVVVAAVPEAFGALAIGERSYVVAVTRGHEMDEEVVAGALGTRARYIGMIGSRRKVGAVMKRLRRRGFSEEDLARVHAPIGLDIGSETVEEIAVSIVAELIAVRRARG